MNIILSKIRSFIDPTTAPKKLYEEIGQQRMKIRELIKEYNSLQTWTDRYSMVLESVTESVSALVWKKDSENRYLLANPLHCKLFYGIENTPECLESLEGKNDHELITKVYRDNNIQNTFGEICMLSDDYTRDMADRCHFIEGGIVDGNEVLLYVIKIPQYDTHTKEYKGTVGIAWNVTEHSLFVINQLKRWIYDKRAKKLYKSDDVFVYSFLPIADTCSIFHHICSDPKRDGECLQGNCDKCQKERRHYCDKYSGLGENS